MLAESRGALVSLQARDFERAITFYTAVLGLEMTFRHESAWAELRAPGLTLGIGPAGDAVVVGGGTATICFEVADIESVVERLRSRGVSFQGGIIDQFHGREAYFTDSEGNPLMLHQSSSAQPAKTPSARPAKRARAAAKPARAARPAAKKTAPAKARPRRAAKPRAKGRKGKGRRR
jgi:predicted enzyme related to lactoylglutathione lyase